MLGLGRGELQNMSKLMRLSTRGPDRRLLTITLIIVGVCLLSGVYGWKTADYSWSDSLYRALLALGASDIYTDSHHWCWRISDGPECERPEISLVSYIALNVARYSGLIFLFGAVLYTVISLLSRSIAQLRSDLGGRRLICIGDSDLPREAFRSEDASGLTRVWLGAAHAINQWRGVAVPWSESRSEAKSIAKTIRSAKQILICAGDDAKTLSYVHAVMNNSPDSPERAVQITAIFERPGSTSEALRHAINKFSNATSSIRALTYSKIAVRDVVKSHPPFVLADQLRQQSVHVLIIGLGRVGRTLLDDIAVNCATVQFGKPYITIIDPDIKRKKAWIYTEAPEIDEVCHLHMIEGGLGQQFEHPEALPPNLPEITAVYICVRDGNLAIEALSGLRTWLQGQGKVPTNIFVRTNTLSLAESSPAGSQEKLRSFGTYKAVLRESQYLSEDPDHLPRRYHEVYKDQASRKTEYGRALDWQTLPEPMKASNRALVEHLQTKMFCANLEAKACVDQLGNVELGCNKTLYEDGKELEALAEIEHNRFVAERRMAGWTKGPRDETLKQDPNFISYNELTDDMKAFDRLIIKLTQTLLKDG